MSSRALRKLQREQELQRQVEAAKKAYEEAEDSEEEDEVLDPIPATSRPKNAFDMLEDGKEDEDFDEDEETSDQPPTPLANSEEKPPTEPSPHHITKSKKKKKKPKKKGKSKSEQSQEQGTGSGDEVDRALKQLAAKEGRTQATLNGSQGTPSWEARAAKLLAIDSHNLNPVNEMKSLFGNIALESQESRSSPRNQQRRDQNQQGGVDLATALTGRYSVASRGKELGALAHRRNVFGPGKEDWPLSTSGGLSMELIKPESGAEESREQRYNILHNNTYQETQVHFRVAVEMMDPQRMIGLLSMYPYHIATLLQVSEIAKHQGDHAVAGDLVERALFSFGKSVHSTFPVALRSGAARVPFNRPANRELYLTIWRNIKNLEMKGTWRTAFEWSKILLQLNPLTDPYGVTLMIDQLALRGRQHAQLIELCSDDAYGQAWDFLPNIQISLALALLRSGRPRDARTRLAIAMHKYPYLLSALASALDISPLPKSLWAKLPSTDAEKLYTELYVSRAKDLWNTPETISLLGEVAETLPHYKDAISAAAEAPKLEISLEEARHIMLLEIPALIALLPRKFTSMPTSSGDVLPPPSSQSDFIARAPAGAQPGGLDATMQTIFNAAGATAGTAGSLLTRIMNWFQAPATAGDAIGESAGQAALRELQEQLGGQIPQEMIEELLQMHIDDAQEDLGEGVTAAGLGMVGGWDYYEEADQENLTSDDGDHDSMPDLESIPDTNTLHEAELTPPQTHAARVEDAAEDDEDGEPTPRRPLPSTRAILRHVDSDDEEDDEQDVMGGGTLTPAVRPTQPQPTQRPAAPSASSTSAQASSISGDDEFRDPQRVQRWLLTTGLTDLQSNPGSTESLRHYIEKLGLLPSRQQDWIVRMVKQRAGAEIERKVRDAMGN